MASAVEGRSWLPLLIRYSRIKNTTGTVRSQCRAAPTCGPLAREDPPGRSRTLQQAIVLVPVPPPPLPPFPRPWPTLRAAAPPPTNTCRCSPTGDHQLTPQTPLLPAPTPTTTPHPPPT